MIRRMRFEPMKPAPPVTSKFITLFARENQTRFRTSVGVDSATVVHRSAKTLFDANLRSEPCIQQLGYIQVHVLDLHHLMEGGWLDRADATGGISAVADEVDQVEKAVGPTATDVNYLVQGGTVEAMPHRTTGVINVDVIADEFASVV